jgi:hypothetical protein
MLAQVATVLLFVVGADGGTVEQTQMMLSVGWDRSGSLSIKRAEPYIQSLEAARSSDSDVALAVALTYMRHNRFAEADRELARVLSARPDDLVAQLAVAWILMLKKEHSKAIPQLEALVAAASDATDKETKLMLRLVGSYLAYAASHDQVRADLIEPARQRINKALGPQRQKELERQMRLAASVRDVLQRDGGEAAPDSHPDAPDEAELIGEASQLEAQLKSKVAAVDAKIQVLQQEFHRRARLAARLYEELRDINQERNQYLDNPQGETYLALQRQAVAKQQQVQAAQAGAKQIAYQGASLVRLRERTIKTYRTKLKKLGRDIGKFAGSASSATTGNPQSVSLRDVCDFPLLEARQIVLMRLLDGVDAAIDDEGARVWTSSNGRSRMIGDYLKQDETHATLVQPNGDWLRVEIAKLSAPDRDFLNDIKSAPLAAPAMGELTKYQWKERTGAHPFSVAGDAGFGFWYSIGGRIGPDEHFNLNVNAENRWQVSGHSTKFLRATAVVGPSQWRSFFQPKIERKNWTMGQPPVRLIHKSEGFCTLAVVHGDFRSPDGLVRVYLADDNYWYISGASKSRDTFATANIHRLKKPGSLIIDVQERHWKNKQPRVPVGKTDDESVSYISGIGGVFRDGGCVVALRPQDGTLYLGGNRTGKPNRSFISGRALTLRFYENN